MSFYFNAPIQIPDGQGINLVDSTNGNAIVFKAPTEVSSNYTLKMPSAIGTANQYLQLLDTGGNLGFADVSGGGLSNVYLSNIEPGDSTSNLTTTTGSITLYSQDDTVNIRSADTKEIFFYQGTTNVIEIDGTGVTNFNNTTTSTTSATGAVVVDGGVGVAENLNVGQNANVVGTLDVVGAVNINNTTTSTTSTTGALIVDGGVGVAENLNVGGTLDVNGVTNVNATTTSTSSTTGALVVDGGVGVAENLNVGQNANVVGTLDVVGAVNINNTTTSTTSTTGALVVDGGIGVAENLNVGGTLDVTGITNLNDTTQSTSATTGALIIDGGVGIAKNLYVGGNLTVNGTTTTVNSNVTTINDPVIELGLGSGSDSFDRGIIYHYDLGGTAKKGFFGWDRSEGGEANTFVYYSNVDVTSGSNVVASGELGNAKFAAVTADTGLTVNSGGLTVTAGGITVTADDLTVDSGNFNVDTGDSTLQNTTIASNLTLQGHFFMDVDSFSNTGAGLSTSRKELIDSTSLACIKSFDLSNANTLYYNCNTVASSTGQLVHLFYNNTQSGAANIAFQGSNLFAGTGAASFLVFTQTGQSATLVYLGASDVPNPRTSGWRIINTGATVY